MYYYYYYYYRIAVHKHILASSSAYFDTLFSNYEKKELRMEYMDLEIVQSLLEYCYTGIISKEEYAYMYCIIVYNKCSNLLIY